MKPTPVCLPPMEAIDFPLKGAGAPPVHCIDNLLLLISFLKRWQPGMVRWDSETA